MTELEKMLAGGPYDWRDEELLDIWKRGKDLMQQYNSLSYTDTRGRSEILRRLFGGVGESVQVTAPIYIDYGRFIHIGDNSEVNMNCVFLDCNYIRIGRNVMIAPGVHIYTVFHPLRAEERLIEAAGASPQAMGLTAPVTIKDDAWIGGNSVIMPGVTIGEKSVVGAGSVVTKSVPDGVLALGNPCRVVREIT